MSAGVAWTNPNYAGLTSQSFVGAAIGVTAGYTLSRYFNVGLDFNTVEKKVSRLSSGDPFTAGLRTQADCNKCEIPPAGGWVTDTTVFFGNLAPRFEFTPMGPESGPYVAATAGVAIAQLLGVNAGFGGGLRAGYRHRVAKIVDVGIEASAQGQTFGNGTTLSFSGAAVFRPHF